MALQRVVYLFGAGASHACVKAVNSGYGILMRDLNEELAKRLRIAVTNQFSGDAALNDLMNNVVDDRTDFEHIITFLDDSCSRIHKDFAETMRRTFEQVLRDRLTDIQIELGDTPDGLYFTLLDMYAVKGFNEELGGLLTLNYDGYLESAISRRSDLQLDLGIRLSPPVALTLAPLRLLKLHGSFTWAETWPITSVLDVPLWIPPGIQKAKEQYPYNLIWGLARELLDCDVLRIVGCRVGANDWDLVSLLFTTRHTNRERPPYDIEIIDSPEQAKRIQSEFPYLGAKSLLQIESVGSQIIAEFIGGGPRPYDVLTPSEVQSLSEAVSTPQNWFRIWLKQKAEAMFNDLGDISTPQGALEGLLEAP
jgi:hypothetical protein